MPLNQDKIFVEYLQLFPHTISVFVLNSLGDEMMDNLIIEMEKAIKENKPLTDALFGFPDGAEY
jgi:hypothetical protein